MARHRTSAVALAAALLAASPLAGCSGSSSAAPDCSATATRTDILGLAGAWYLYAGQVGFAAFDPASPTLSPSEFLDAIVNSAGAPDAGRHFSYLTTKTASAQFFEEGTSLGFGLGLHFEGADRLLVSQVFGDGLDPQDALYPQRSAAVKAGFARGDEIIAIAPGSAPTPSAAGLDAPARQVSAILAQDALTPGALSAAFSSGVAGTVRDFRLKKVGTGAVLDVQASAATYSLDPVPHYLAPTVLTSPGGRRVGYLMLRSFILPAQERLKAAFGRFKAEGVTDLIVDLRYDGGGRLEVAGTFLGLMSAGRAGATAFGLRHNAARAPANDVTFTVAAEPNGLAPARVAFIVTGGSASASELLPFALAPALGADVALVGDRTLGKPVGQYGFSGPDCPTVYVLLSFQLANGAGLAQYYGGLPDPAWTGSSCSAPDDLTHPTGDPAEGSTLVALQWIDGGAAACTPIAPAAPTARLARTAGGPGAPEPSLAQRHVPGLF